MVHLDGGTFLMGSNDAEGFRENGEGPIREVRLNRFHISATAVTIAQFAMFIKATGYVTDAERFGWSFVFHAFLPASKARRLPAPLEAPWWRAVPNASWKQPEGPGSRIQDRQNHPVTHVSWNDSFAYCAWAGTRLPTEAEWEYAARGALIQKRFPWGDELTPGGVHRANIWQGVFPTTNTGADGHVGTAPVKTYRPNGFGLYNMAGNVWEWCADWFTTDHTAAQPLVNPAGPATGESRVIRGGSYLCHDSYCNRYRVAARSHNTPESSTGNTGLRYAGDPSD